jgi:hypothetical protein
MFIAPMAKLEIGEIPDSLLTLGMIFSILILDRAFRETGKPP